MATFFPFTIPYCSVKTAHNNANNTNDDAAELNHRAKYGYVIKLFSLRNSLIPRLSSHPRSWQYFDEIQVFNHYLAKSRKRYKIRTEG